MASSRTQISSGGKIPDGFVSPFKRVQTEERNEDAFSCLATLTGRTLEEVGKLAVQLGYPPHGPAYVTDPLLTKLLHNLGLKRGDWEELQSIAALPDVAILLVDWKAEMEIGRYVVWHHVRGTDAYPSFSYVIDPAPFVDPERRVTADFSGLKLNPAWYIEITPRPNGKNK